MFVCLFKPNNLGSLQYTKPAINPHSQNLAFWIQLDTALLSIVCRGSLCSDMNVWTLMRNVRDGSDQPGIKQQFMYGLQKTKLSVFPLFLTYLSPHNSCTPEYHVKICCGMVAQSYGTLNS